MTRFKPLAALILAALAGCSATVVELERDGLKLTVRDTQILHERSIGGAEFDKAADGTVSVKVKDAKTSNAAAADALKVAADALSKM